MTETDGLYATPQLVTRVEDCRFYHTMEIPGHGVVQGQWDLRGMERTYLGNVDFRDKRVLEVGPASGFFSFYMERQGAEVVSLEYAPGEPLDHAPFARPEPAAPAAGPGTLPYFGHGFWFAHRMFKSRVRVVYGNVYKIPEAIGPVQIATLTNVLLHLRDPFLALQNVVRLTTETIIVTDTIAGRLPTPLPPFLRRLRFFRNMAKKGYWSVKFYNALAKESMLFLPRAPAELTSRTMWWGLTPGIVRQFLRVLGFGQATVSYHTQLYGTQDWIPHFTVVGRRTDPI